MPNGVKPGERRGGRAKGTPNKKTQALINAVEGGGETPLDYMLRVMRDISAENNRRDDMAKSAAPYLHARLANVAHTGANGGPVEHSHTVAWKVVDPAAGTA
jgi:hypothetical protein